MTDTPTILHSIQHNIGYITETVFAWILTIFSFKVNITGAQIPYGHEYVVNILPYFQLLMTILTIAFTSVSIYKIGKDLKWWKK